MPSRWREGSTASRWRYPRSRASAGDRVAGDGAIGGDAVRLAGVARTASSSPPPSSAQNASNALALVHRQDLGLVTPPRPSQADRRVGGGDVSEVVAKEVEALVLAEASREERRQLALVQGTGEDLKGYASGGEYLEFARDVLWSRRRPVRQRTQHHGVRGSPPGRDLEVGAPHHRSSAAITGLGWRGIEHAFGP